MTDIVERLRAYAKDQGGWHNIDDTCEEAADEIERLREAHEVTAADLHAWMKLKAAAEARLAEAAEVVRILLEVYSAYFKPGNPWADKVRETLGIEAPETHDTTNPFAPRERPKKSCRLMTDDERRAAGLDPNGGFDGPTGAD